MGKRKVDTATEAEWAFVDNEDAMKAVKGAARQLGAKWSDYIEVDDAEQDALMWLAVRPERVTRLEQGASYVRLHQDIYTNLNKEYDVRFARIETVPHDEVFIAED